MTNAKWEVRIPARRWMAGANRFRTKARALHFIAAWNETEAKSGNDSLTFYRFGPTTFEAAE